MEFSLRGAQNLRQIAKAQLGDGALYMRIAELNGLRDPGRLAPGQRLEIPSKEPMHCQFCSGY